MGKGSNQPSTETVNQTTSSIPTQLLPYEQSILQQGQSLANQPYVTYGGQQVANLSPYTGQSYQAAQNLGNVGTGSINMGLQSLGLGQNTLGQAANTANSLQNINAPTVNAGSLTNYQMGNVGQVQSGNWTDPGVAQQYMNPYETQALQAQYNIANQQFGQQQNELNSQAVQSGAFGGDRAGLVQQQAQNNFNLQMQNMQAQGLANAYTQGQSTFQSQNSANLLAQEANQQAAEQVGSQNLQANLGVQQLGSTLGLNAQEANAGNYLQSLQQENQAAQLGGSLGSQYGSLGSQYGSLGSEQNSLASNAMNALYAAGQSQQNYQQQGLNTAYNNFVNQQNYPSNQLNMLSGILHGFNVPASTYSTTSTPSNGLSQLLGAGVGVTGLQQLLGSSG